MSACPECGKPAKHLALLIPMSDPKLPLEVEHLCENEKCGTTFFYEAARYPRAIITEALRERGL